MTPRILAFSGSLRADSWNSRIVRIPAEAARRAGADVTVIELRTYPLPLFDEDIEAAGTPAEALRLREAFRAHDALLIAAPEYNSSLTAALKNAIDWVSRPEAGRPPLDCFQGKVAALLSASPGALGGLRGLVHLRAILGNIGVCLLPEQLAIGQVHTALQPDGTLKDARQQAALEGLGARLVDVARRLKA